MTRTSSYISLLIHLPCWEKYIGEPLSLSLLVSHLFSLCPFFNIIQLLDAYLLALLSPFTCPRHPSELSLLPPKLCMLFRGSYRVHTEIINLVFIIRISAQFSSRCTRRFWFQLLLSFSLYAFISTLSLFSLFFIFYVILSLALFLSVATLPHSFCHFLVSFLQLLSEDSGKASLFETSSRN